MFGLSLFPVKPVLLAHPRKDRISVGVVMRLTLGVLLGAAIAGAVPFWVFPVVGSAVHVHARSTDTLARLDLSQVVISERVAALAMGFPGVLGGRPFATKYVDAHRNRIEVLRVTAGSDTTEMVNGQSGRNRADKAFVRESVPEALLAFSVRSVPADIDFRVAIVVGSLPVPVIVTGLRGQPRRESLVFRHLSNIQYVDGQRTYRSEDS